MLLKPAEYHSKAPSSSSQLPVNAMWNQANLNCQRNKEETDESVAIWNEAAPCSAPLQFNGLSTPQGWASHPVAPQSPPRTSKRLWKETVFASTEKEKYFEMQKVREFLMQSVAGCLPTTATGQN